MSFLPGPSADGGSGMGEPSHHHTATMASAVSPNDSKAGTAVRRVRKRDTALPLTLEPRHAKRGGLRRALCWTKPGPSLACYPPARCLNHGPIGWPRETSFSSALKRL